MNREAVMDGFKVKVETVLKEEDVDSLLVSALEGGSNSWAVIEKYADRKKDKANGCKYISDYIMKGSGLMISNGVEEREDSKDFKKTWVNRLSIECALQTLATKYPNTFNDIITDNADAITGDMLLQICVLGDVIYG
jgi:uncharacterized membrane protein